MNEVVAHYTRVSSETMVEQKGVAGREAATGRVGQKIF